MSCRLTFAYPNFTGICPFSRIVSFPSAFSALLLRVQRGFSTVKPLPYPVAEGVTNHGGSKVSTSGLDRVACYWLSPASKVAVVFPHF